jgi:hypothetical protein
MVFTLRLPRSMSVRTALGGAPLFGAPPGAPLERHGWTVSRRRRSARVGRPVLATNPRRGYFSCPRSRGAPVVVAKNWFGKSRGPRDWRRARSPLLPTCRQRQGSDYILNGTTVGLGARPPVAAKRRTSLRVHVSSRECAMTSYRVRSLLNVRDLTLAVFGARFSTSSRVLARS